MTSQPAATPRPLAAAVGLILIGDFAERIGLMRPTKSRSHFTRLAKATSRLAGRPSAFTLAVGVLLAWAVTGPVFRFSDSWQLVINTGTTIVTFLMVFLI